MRAPSATAKLETNLGTVRERAVRDAMATHSKRRSQDGTVGLRKV